MSGAVEAKALLAVQALSKTFGGNHVLRNVSLSFAAGEVHALLGENGAGKSTLVKILTGVHRADAGEILFDGDPVVLNSPLDARRLGISAIYQEPLAFPDLTVAENIFMGRHPVRRGTRRIDWKPVYAEAEQVLRSVGARFSAHTQVASLSTASRQLVEIAKALSVRARVLIMDEPTSSLSKHEVNELFTVIRKLRALGTAIIFISHRLEEVSEISDRVSVLRDGQFVATRPIAETTREDMIQMMVGRKLSALFPKQPAKIGDVVLRTRGLSKKGVFHDISFELRSGEILGLAGLVGAKRTDVAEAIFGVKPADSGTIEVAGRDVTIRNPRQAVSLGISYVPEDRQHHGLIGQMSIAENITLPLLDQFSHGGLIDFQREARHAESWRKRINIALASVRQSARELSGGNQQKVVLAKWLSPKPRILLLDEPTRGIDVGTKAEVHRLISALAGEGLAILLISSELPEVLGMSDRVIVMREGHLTREFGRDEATQENIMRAATENVRDRREEELRVDQ